jgi:hypothetical protein
MWYPQNWNEITQLVTNAAEESDVLDFKRELGKSEELAKDVAAMTVNGGVIILGVEEDQETRTATEVIPIALKGSEEKIRQVAGSRISPPPEFRVTQIPSEDDPTVGALVIEIPASPSAPHTTNDRFPRRHGSVTAYLSEPDIERLYEQRKRLIGGAAAGRKRMAEFTPAPFAAAAAGAIGALDVLVRPISGSNLTLTAWQGEHLVQAAQSTISRLYERYPNLTHLHATDALTEWRAWDTVGWMAGSLSGITSNAEDPPQVAGFFGYPAALSFQARFGLTVRSDRQHELYRSAREPSVAIELMAMLVFAAEYFVATLGGGLLHAELSVSGFGGAKSIGQTRNRPGGFEYAPGAPDICQADRIAGAYELLDDPEAASLSLIERWLPAFCSQDDDLFRWLRDRHA